MLQQSILFIKTQTALAHSTHDNPFAELSGTAPIIFKNQKQIPCEAIKGITGPQISTRFPDKKDRYDLSAEFVDKDGKILVKASFIRTFPE